MKELHPLSIFHPVEKGKNLPSLNQDFIGNMKIYKGWKCGEDGIEMTDSSAGIFREKNSMRLLNFAKTIRSQKTKSLTTEAET